MISNKPSQHFQDREEAIATFDQLWTSLNTKVLVFDGFSGHGKSTLITWLIENRCQKRNIPYSFINLKIEHGFTELLSSILRGNSRLPIPEDAYRLFNQKQEGILADLSQFKHQVTVEQTQINSPNSNQTVNLGIAEAYRLEEKYARTRLSEAWLACLKQFEGDQLVIFLDTFENFIDTAAPETVNWLWSILNDALKSVSGLRIIIGSRQPLPDGFIEGIVRKELETFSPQDSDTLLINLGVSDGAFRQAVYERLAKGHPFVTALAANAWLASTQTLDPNSIPNLLDVGNYDKAVNWIQQEIIARLQEPLKSTVRWIPLLRRFNLDILNNVLGNILQGHLTNDDFEKLRRYAFVRRVDTSWRCHDLLRGVQFSHLRNTQPQTFFDFHRRASQYFESIDDIESLYHQFFGTEDAYNQWQLRVNLAERANNHKLSERLFEIVEMPEVKLTPIQWADFVMRKGEHTEFRGDVQAARKYYSVGFETFEKLKHPLGQAYALKHLGQVEAEQGNDREARTFYLDSLKFYSSTDHRRERAEIFLLLGDLSASKTSNEAEGFYREAVSLFEDIGDSMGASNVYLGLGNLLHLQGKDTDARTQYEKALNLYRQNHQIQGEGNALRRLGDLELGDDNFDQALQHYKIAQSIYKTTGNKRGQANVLLGIGILYTEKGDLLLARQNFLAAYDIYAYMGDIQGQANIIVQYGVLDELAGMVEQGEMHYGDALNLYRKIGEYQGQANTLHRLAGLSIQTGDLDNAQNLCIEARQLFDQTGDIRGQANVLLTLASIALQKESMSEVRSYAREALRLCVQFNNSAAQVELLWLIGISAWRGGEIQRARAYLRKALIIGENVVQIFELYLNILHSLANLERTQVNIEKSREHYKLLLYFAGHPSVTDHDQFMQWQDEYESLSSSVVTEEQRENLLTTWLNSKTWKASKQYLKQYEPILLSDESLRTLRLLLREHPGEKMLIQQGIDLVERSRKIGIDATYKQFEYTLEQRQLQPLLVQWISSRNIKASKNYLKKYQNKLLTDDAEAALQRIAEINPEMENRVNVFAKLLRACRAVGIEAAYEDL